ncbi:MAG TPA: acyl carrier protein [Flavobacteriales bacterium]|nr:acyl carrier protein [Flavobacteriales bacterium]
MTQYNNDSNGEKILSRFFVEREGEGVLGSLKSIDLIDSGILDSLDIVTLASFIEEEFAVKLDLTDTNTFNAVRRFDSLMELIQK